MKLMPNCEHSLAENIPGVIETLTSFMLGVFDKEYGAVLPKFNWTIEESGTKITL